MPIIKSAKKRVRIAKKASVRNAKTKHNFRQAIRDFQTKLSGKSTNTGKALSQAESALDIAAKKGLLHKKTVARKKKQLSALSKEAGIKRTPTKKIPQNTNTAKKAPATKKTPAKSTTKTKMTPKKPVAKKAAKK